MMRLRQILVRHMTLVVSRKRKRLSCLLGVFALGVVFVCEERRQNKNNPLIQAIFRDEVGTVQKILAGGADPNSINDLGDTGLHMLFQSGNDVARHIKEILQLFLDYFVDVTIPNKVGEEPLVYVDRIFSIPKKLSFIGMLVMHGAHIDGRTAYGALFDGKPSGGMTLLDLFVQTDGTPTVEAFMAWWGWLISADTLKSAKKWAADLKYTDIIAVLEKNNVFITQKMVQEVEPEWRHPHIGFDLLSMLVIKRDVKLLKELLDRNKFNINQTLGSVFSKSIDNTYTPSLEKEVFDFSQKGVTAFSGGIHFGYTPLHLAVLQRDISLVSYLLDRGANPTIQALNGNTALHCIMYIDPHYSASNLDLIVRLATVLIENGADLNARNKNNDTVLHIAIKRGATELVRRLWTQFKNKLFSNTQKSLMQLSKKVGIVEIESLLKGK